MTIQSQTLKLKNLIATTTAAILITAGSLIAQQPYAKPNNSWISLSGVVTRVNPDTFVLDYGDGSIVVEMDDWDADADAYKVVKGDRVTVNGFIDDDFFEARTIEAGSVYVEGLNTYFYASSADEEDAFVTIDPVSVGNITVQGVVTDVGGDEFMLDHGIRQIQIEVDEMVYDPLDDEGFQRIEVGDRVSVTGELDDDFLEGRVVEADTIVTLSENPDL